jgi:signal transduction histidine kinase/CheY-like chemotaxis protein
MKNKRCLNILENMSSGFVSISNGVVRYINTTFLNILEMNNTIFNKETQYQKVFSLLGNLTTDISVFSREARVDSNSCLTELYNYLNKISHGEENKFHYLGSTIFITDNCSKIYFEVFGRRITEGEEDQFEFLFNDVTRVKQQEEANADFKYKTLFLSKVAHEFKNPILCITELVTEIKEDIESNQDREQVSNRKHLTDILKQIKSISDYLLILIKDLDYFSQKSVKNAKNVLERSQVNLDEIVEFCNNIVYSLIRKLNKDKDVVFTVDINETVPRYLNSDETKLKQVLVNLLSNSVKYTYKGFISLSIDYVNREFKFHIKDTGKGISDIQKRNLFIPFSIENSSSFISAGLGLYIVKEIIELMGSSISYSSKLGAGSEFWFNISIGEHFEDRLCDNSIRIKKGRKSSTSLITIEKEFYPNNFNRQLAEEALRDNILANDCNCNCRLYISPNNSFTVLVVDDEELTRRSAIRQIKQYCRDEGIVVNIVEASDGIECLNILYQCFRNNIKISFVLCDENMNFLNGTYCAEIINNIYLNKGLGVVDFYMLSAYENLNVKTYIGVKKVLTKPLTKRHLTEILNLLD